MHIRIDDLRGPEVTLLLQEHLDDMYAITPPESVHALDLDALRAPDVTFWTVWDSKSLLGCGALKVIDPTHGEIKSMRTATAHRGKGVASHLLKHVLHEARARSIQRLSLETGSMQEFAAARGLYDSFGFTYCPPFGDYVEDPNSVFMTLALKSTE